MDVPEGATIERSKQQRFDLKIGPGYTVYEHPYSGVETTVKSLDGTIPSRVFPSACIVEDLQAKLKAAESRIREQKEEITSLRTVVAGLEQDLRTVILEERALARGREKSLRVEQEKETSQLKRRIKRLQRDKGNDVTRSLQWQEARTLKPELDASGCTAAISRNRHQEYRVEREPRKMQGKDARSGRDELETRFPNLWLYEAESTQF